MKEILSLYRDRLTDLTARNKSLRLMRLTNKDHFDLNSFSNIEEGLGARILQDVCHAKDLIPLIPYSNFHEEEILISRKLVHLKRQIELIEQETGMNTFYVAYGFLEGHLVDDFFLRSPILFYPARLVRTTHKNTPYWALKIEDEETPFINRTFLLAAQKFLGLQLTEQLQDKLEVLPKESKAVLSFLFDLLKEYKVPLKETPDESLISFKAMKKADIPSEKSKGFEIKPYAVMGKFQQSTSTLLVDYEDFLGEAPEHGLLQEWLGGTTDENELDEIRTEILNEVNEKDTFFVLETDASQEASVVSSHKRKGLIVHGPPGTGKSQVIVNLVADRMARGQRVLLVCQKPAALEVVYNRLGAIHLQSHVALVPDFNLSKGDVYRKIASVLDKQVANSSDKHLAVSQEMQILSNKLNLVASSLHAERPFGKSLHELYTNTQWSQEMIMDVTGLLGELTDRQLQEHLVELKTTFDLMQKYDHPDFPWVNRKSFANFTAGEQMQMDELLKQLVKDAEEANEIRNRTELHDPPSYYFANHTALEGLKKALLILQNRSMSKHILMFYRDEEREFETEDHFNKMKQGHDSLKKQLDRLSSRPAPITHLTEQEAKEWSGKINQLLQLNDKFKRFVSGTWYNLRKQIKMHCATHNVPFDGNAVRKYFERVESFLMFEQLRRDASKMFFYSDSPIANEYDDWERWIGHKARALEFLDLYVQAQTTFPKWLQNLQSQEDLQVMIDPKFEEHVDTLIKVSSLTEKLQTTVAKLVPYLQPAETDSYRKEMDQGIYDLVKYRGLLNTIDSFDSLCRLDQMKGDMGDFKKQLIALCQEKSPIHTTPNVVVHWTTLIQNSFMHAWILKVEAEEPHVKDVSTEIYSHNLSRYKKLLHEKRKSVPAHIDKVLHLQALEVQGATRKKVKSEANKKRRQAPLRTMLSNFTDDLLKLVPCWLCTPEAVSAIFPNTPGLFDLVIFDEASQCPVENAIPALHRGKQVVVAGDEKQLPPSSFFQVSTEDDENEEDEDNTVYKDRTDKEAKSLLEWAKPRMSDQWLTWHYRSKHQELINFSNYAFYGKRMQIAPSVYQKHESKPIEFRQVEGKWINRSNRQEAEEVVDLVIDILKNDPSYPTLGIIAFNKNQADLINDVFDERMQQSPEVQVLVEAAKQRKIGDEHVGLFVKNIENVQGDERDMIVFSVGYAENEEGKMVSQFGPLGQEHGPNRLNVAITRAKEKVYVVCSFDPSQWTRADNYAKGVRLFKNYLEYAKAVSEGNHDQMRVILDKLIDPTEVQDPERPVSYDSPFEQQVREALLDKYKVHTQIGFSGYRIDLGVICPDTQTRYILGIECDGAMFHSSKVARERDLYRQRFLESQGWKIHRIWSRNWWKGQEKEVEKVVAVIEELRAMAGKITQP